MASYTTNLNLKKPAGSENVAIGDINNNMDIIDQAYGALKLTKKTYTITVTAAAAAPLGYYGSVNIQSDKNAYGEPVSVYGVDKNGYSTPVAYGNNNYIGVCARVEGDCSVTVIFSKHTTSA